MRKCLIIVSTALFAAISGYGQQQQNIIVPNINIDGIPLNKKVAKPLADTGQREEAMQAIVIIDDKIYTLQSKEFKSIDSADIAEMRIVTDEKSPSTIKTVIIIKLKKK